MTLLNQFETNNEQPTDQSLVDYLLGESLEGDAIERWLAQDESHLLRLECLAEVVCAISSSDVVSSKPADAISVLGGQSIQPAEMGFGSMRWMIALASLAASVSLIFLWARDRESDQRIANDRLAVVWAEVLSTDEQSNAAAGEMSDAWLGEIASTESESPVDIGAGWTNDYEPNVEGEFASGNDSPPQWLLVAISQMTENASSDDKDGAIRQEDIQ